MNTEDFLNVAKELARKAGDLCLELQNNLGDVRYKTVKDVVTIARHIPSAPKKRASSKAPIRATAGLSTRLMVR